LKKGQIFENYLGFSARGGKKGNKEGISTQMEKRRLEKYLEILSGGRSGMHPDHFQRDIEGICLPQPEGGKKP